MLSEVVEWEVRLRPRKEGSMSILIKGMAMPKSCWDCPMVSGYELADERKAQYSTIRCRLTNKRRPIGEPIANDCPLVELPPHGRLIDADALTTVTEMVNGEFKTYIEVFEITDAPTIIEADSTQTNDSNALDALESE